MWIQIFSPWTQDEEWSYEAFIMHTDFYVVRKELKIKENSALHEKPLTNISLTF